MCIHSFFRNIAKYAVKEKKTAVQLPVWYAAPLFCYSPLLRFLSRISVDLLMPVSLAVWV